MTRKPKAYCAALPLSALPELREFLGPFLGKGTNRDHVVMMRLGEEALQRLDDLVEAGLFGSRSEAAAFLVGAGIQSQNELFERITRYSSDIRKIRSELRRTALKTLRAAEGRPQRRRKS